MLRFVTANQKGGVGKTIDRVNLAASLAHYGRRVLLVDLDPQGNATMRERRRQARVRRDRLRRAPRRMHGWRGCARAPVRGRLRRASPSNRELAGARGRADRHSSDARDRLRRRRSSAGARPTTTSSLIDCPPALNLLTLERLHRGRMRVIIPMQCEYYALEGLSDLVGTHRRCSRTSIRGIEIEALAAHDVRPAQHALACRSPSELKQHFGDKVYRHRRSRATCASPRRPSYGDACVPLHDPAIEGRAGAPALARELLERNGFKVKEAA